MAGAMQQRGRDNRAEAERSRGHEDGGGKPGGDGHVVTIHHDGSQYHAQHSDGETTQHEHLHGAMAEAGSRHMGGVHHMMHHDGMGGPMVTHHAAHGESAEGPNEHPDMESVKAEMDEMNDDGQGEMRPGPADHGTADAGEDEY
jgi:hypothetical protein